MPIVGHIPAHTRSLDRSSCEKFSRAITGSQGVSLIPRLSCLAKVSTIMNPLPLLLNPPTPPNINYSLHRVMYDIMEVLNLRGVVGLNIKGMGVMSFQSLSLSCCVQFM